MCQRPDIRVGVDDVDDGHKHHENWTRPSPIREKGRGQRVLSSCASAFSTTMIAVEHPLTSIGAFRSGKGLLISLRQRTERCLQLLCRVFRSNMPSAPSIVPEIMVLTPRDTGAPIFGGCRLASVASASRPVDGQAV